MATGSKKLRKTKDGKPSYQIVVENGRDALTGKRIRHYYTFRGTEKQAEKALRKYISDVENGGVTTNSNTQLSTWMNEWLDVYKTEISPTTRAGYKEKMKNHIIPHLGHLTLNSITPSHIQKWVNMLYNDKGLSPKTIRNTFQSLFACLEKARKLKMIKTNPCEDIQLPKSKKYNVKVYSEAEIKNVLKLTKGSFLYVVALLGLGLGLRRGEMVALTWDDIDFDEKVVHIRKNAVVVDGKPLIKDPKSASGIRDITISSAIANELYIIYLEYVRDKEKYGTRFKDNNLVVRQPMGEMYNPNSITRAWNRFTKANNLKHIRLHDMRHTNATAMIEQGVDIKTIQQRLGHSDITTTLNVYAHVTKKMNESAANKIDKILFTEAIMG